MRLKYFAIFSFIVVMTLTGCDGNEIESPFFLEEIPPPSDIADSLYTLTASGLKYYDLLEGSGSEADEGLAVEYHYILWLSDSTLVNSSYRLQIPQVHVLGNDGLPTGWSEGFIGMKTGGFRQLIIPPDLAYGEQGSLGQNIPPNETIIMELALLTIGVPNEDPDDPDTSS